MNCQAQQLNRRAVPVDSDAELLRSPRPARAFIPASPYMPMNRANASSHHCGKAEHCIFIWLGGGACQIDTFDPKRQGDGRKKRRLVLRRHRHGRSRRAGLRASQPACTAAGSLRAVAHRASQVDRRACRRDEPHAHRPADQRHDRLSVDRLDRRARAAASDGVPAYVVIGYPNVTRGPGFLGAKSGYVYLTETEAGPSGLTSAARDHRRSSGAARSAGGQASRSIEGGSSDRRQAPRLRRRRRGRLPTGRAGVHERLRPDQRAGFAAKRLRRRVRPALPAGAAAGQAACGSSRCRPT